jgi:hypothetical protein
MAEAFVSGLSIVNEVNYSTYEVGDGRVISDVVAVLVVHPRGDGVSAHDKCPGFPKLKLADRLGDAGPVRWEGLVAEKRPDLLHRDGVVPAAVGEDVEKETDFGVGGNLALEMECHVLVALLEALEFVELVFGKGFVGQYTHGTLNTVGAVFANVQ